MREKTQGKERTEEEQSRDPQGRNVGLGSKGLESRTPTPLPAARHSRTGGTCFRMLFITPMKPANNLASSRAASFFSVFFLLHFSTPEAAILRQLGSRPGLAWPGQGLHAEASVCQPTTAAGTAAAAPCSGAGRHRPRPRSVRSGTGAGRGSLRTALEGAGPRVTAARRRGFCPRLAREC